ncbi:hypothetical protein JCM24511_06308 [Saitozyma sp. JCM 24511]|nr:hypothetical protein JCM24511_06308 [Saitozyma sp. JCM 24511]
MEMKMKFMIDHRPGSWRKVDTDADSLAVWPLSNHDEDEESLELLVAVLAVEVVALLMLCRSDS